MSTVATLGPRARPRAERSSLLDAVRFCAMAFLALRVLTLLAGLAAGAFPALRAQGVPGWAAPPVHPGFGDTFSVFERFDALWFLRIAETGYRSGDGSAAFFPLFPLAIRAVSAVIGGHTYAASLLVSNGAFVVALVVLYRLTEFEFGTRTARATIVLLCCFPTAYFFLFPYSESLFLLCAVTAFHGARHRRWWVAGLAAALAASTRSLGFILVPAIAIEAIHQREEGRGSAVPGLTAAAAGALGTLAYLAWWQLRDGDWLIPLVRQQNWERGFS